MNFGISRIRNRKSLPLNEFKKLYIGKLCNCKITYYSRKGDGQEHFYGDRLPDGWTLEEQLKKINPEYLKD